jgi:hypothetical protein
MAILVAASNELPRYNAVDSKFDKEINRLDSIDRHTLVYPLSYNIAVSYMMPMQVDIYHNYVMPPPLSLLL